MESGARFFLYGIRRGVCAPRVPRAPGGAQALFSESREPFEPRAPIFFVLCSRKMNTVSGIRYYLVFPKQRHVNEG